MDGVDSDTGGDMHVMMIVLINLDSSYCSVLRSPTNGDLSKWNTSKCRHCTTSLVDRTVATCDDCSNLDSLHAAFADATTLTAT